jgi:NmrA-like family
MTKIIAVTGATGAQGGSIARIMLKEPGWTVRAITRNPNSDAAKKLASEGATVVQADFDNEGSLVKAFEVKLMYYGQYMMLTRSAKGAHAIFAVTNFWETLFSTMDQTKAGETEEKQAMTLANAAAKTSTLEHYIWHTLPSAAELTNNKFPVPHLDYKAKADDRIRAELPDLAKKTTYLFVGYYPSNMAFFPSIKPLELVRFNFIYIERVLMVCSLDRMASTFN